MKELEALEKIKEALANHLVRQVSTADFTHKKALELLENDTDLQVIHHALTPPSQDEVCRALSDYLRVDVRYDVLAKEFYVCSDSTHITKFGIYGYQIKYYLLPHLITLIGRFYEGIKL